MASASASASASSTSNMPAFDASTAMAYSSSFPSSAMVVTREEFNAFHKIDRTLFARLVFVLGRDIAQSAQVMAFLLWLEHSGQAKNLVAYLISLADAFISAVADEVVVCLNCLCFEDFAVFAANFGLHGNYDVIPLIRHLTRSRLTLRFFHQNRETVIRGFTRNLTEICNRAFEDICARAERYNEEKMLVEERKKAEEEEMSRLMMISRMHHRVPDQGESSIDFAMQSLVLSDEQESTNTTPHPHPPPPVETPRTVMQTGGGSSSGGGGGGGSDSGAAASEEQIPADDRTVFLTFSKGYPITEPEVHTFFTRRFGEVIDVIHMQEVEENEQPLYARMVLRLASTIPAMLGGRNKNKFTINGKHVWARKYVRKGPRSPTGSSRYLGAF